jgi:carnosine N-methyltransferase
MMHLTMSDRCSQYRKRAHYNTTHRRRQNFYALPSSHWQPLAAPPFKYLETLDRVDDAIDANADIADAILSCGLDAFGLSPDPDVSSTLNWRNVATSSDLSKAHSTVRQFFRDWSAEGAKERELCYGPVLRDLSDEFKGNSRSELKILIPGAGLGRLVFETCLAGFNAEGNEISYHQLLASSWVLNHTKPRSHLPLYPFAAQFSNLVSREQQLRKVLIPDVTPSSSVALGVNSDGTGPIGSMSMTAADFVVLYGDSDHEGAYHAVVTVFFIDTAPNLIRYVETIRHCLVNGGIWVNLGPLLWHSNEQDGEQKQGKGTTDTSEDSKERTGIGEPGSMELTEEETVCLVQQMGFDIERHEIQRAECGYIQDPDSMLQHLYRVSHWVARKMD